MEAGEEGGLSSPRWVALSALASWALVAVAVTVLYGHFALDDFFITYRYADNLAAGRGFVFNPGERVFGLTEPAQGLALGLLHLATRIPVPWLGTVSTALGLIGLSWVLVLEARQRGLELEALLGGTLVATLTFFWGCRGAGVIPGLALLALGLHVRRRPWLAGLVAGSAAGFRPELALGIGLAVAFWAWQERRWPWRFMAAAATVLAAGALVCWFYFGTAVPLTLGAKQSFAAWDPAARSSGSHFWPGFVPALARHWGAHWWVFFALGAVGCGLALRRGGLALQTLTALGLLLAFVYPLLGVPLFGWYVIPCLVAAIYGFGFCVPAACRAVARWWERRAWPAPHLAAGAAAVLLLLPAVSSFQSLADALRHPATSRHFEAYREAGLWLAEHSTPGERVTALEVGTLAYFSDRPVMDLLGLVSPASLANVREHRVIAGLEAQPTELFVLTGGLEGLIGPVRTLPWFVERYALVHSLPDEDGEPVWIFRRRDT